MKPKKLLGTTSTLIYFIHLPSCFKSLWHSSRNNNNNNLWQKLKTFLTFYLQLYINHREFLVLKKPHLHHPYNTETWLRISWSQFSLIQRWHISLPVAPTVALVSNGNKLSWQWQVILLLPLGPVGKIPPDASRGMFLSKSLNLQPEPEWKDCRITLIQCGTTPDWQKLWEHAHQTLTASHVMCQHNITLNIFLVFLNMIYRLGHSSKICWGGVF